MTAQPLLLCEEGNIPRKPKLPIFELSHYRYERAIHAADRELKGFFQNWRSPHILWILTRSGEKCSESPRARWLRWGVCLFMLPRLLRRVTRPLAERLRT